jgi:hypothetical protein
VKTSQDGSTHVVLLLKKVRLEPNLVRLEPNLVHRVRVLENTSSPRRKNNTLLVWTRRGRETAAFRGCSQKVESSLLTETFPETDPEAQNP